LETPAAAATAVFYMMIHMKAASSEVETGRQRTILIKNW
jgi:hypothetical protein